MKETISNLPITRNTDLECEIESRLLTGLENRKERGLFLLSFFRRKTPETIWDFLQFPHRPVPCGIASRA